MRRHYAKHRESARDFVLQKIVQWNTHYHFAYNRITIKDTKSRWGSCSIKRNLNFNYRIALLPERLADYIVVHELCHLGEFNHSSKFWTLVGQTIPDYVARRAELRKFVFTRR